MPNTSILPVSENDPFDEPKKFRNIDYEPFECTWDNTVYTVQPNEVVLKPKYLVNYMAMHLARKMYKRKVRSEFQGTEWEKANANIREVNPEEEIKLQTLMVADNFDQPELKKELVQTLVPNETPVIEKKEEIKVEETLTVKEDNPFKCEVCGFVSKSKLGYVSHKRFKHK